MLLLIVNASSIIVLLCLAGVLLAATRFKSGSSIAAIIVFPTIPVYLYNVTRMLDGSHLPEPFSRLPILSTCF